MFEVAATVARGLAMATAPPLDFTPSRQGTVKKEAPKPTFTHTSKAYRCHSVCAACQQPWTWFAKLYGLGINVVFRSHLGNPSSLACIFHRLSDVPTAEKTKRHQLNVEWFSTYQFPSSVSLSASLCPAHMHTPAK